MSNACPWQPILVTLRDGRQVASDSSEWRFECEARYILNLPGKAQRRALLDLIEKRRGERCRKDLEFEILALWKRGQYGNELQA